MAACNGPSSSVQPADDASAAGQGTATDTLLGSEEFGLSKQGLVASIEAVESLIAECMNEAGFEYVAVDYNTVRRGMKSDKSLPGLSERAYTNQYGYGLPTLYTRLGTCRRESRTCASSMICPRPTRSPTTAPSSTAR